jgi:hypothetical protein
VDDPEIAADNDEVTSPTFAGDDGRTAQIETLMAEVQSLKARLEALESR